MILPFCRIKTLVDQLILSKLQTNFNVFSILVRLPAVDLGRWMTWSPRFWTTVMTSRCSGLTRTEAFQTVATNPAQTLTCLLMTGTVPGKIKLTFSGSFSLITDDTLYGFSLNGKLPYLNELETVPFVLHM